MDMTGPVPSSTSMHISSGTATPSISGMHSSQGSMMGMQDMAMAFFVGHSTPLYSYAWTPDTRGQYAGTVIFLLILAVIFRCLLALRCNFTEMFDNFAHASDTALLSQAVDEKAYVRRPWTVNRAVARASLDTVLAGISYLLMLAVMTMNVGYFLSILGGTFLGSFVVGEWAEMAAH